MLFNSYEFIFVFFPISLFLYFLAGRRGRTSRLYALLAASLVFYGWWDARFLALLTLSIAANFSLGRVLSKQVETKALYRSDLWLAIGVSFNLLVLGIFKYANFFAQNVNSIAGTHVNFGHIILPLGISFFTFEQIGYLVDIRRGNLYRADFLSYAVFVSFFPRLVAGPILRYSEIGPQLRDNVKLSADDVAVGLTTFSIGLCKKSFLADGIAPYVAQPFSFAAAGTPVDLFFAWGGALAYTCQLYFDFSGYSDMAIGAARCFGIRFPANFNSPYKAGGVIEFWRRWHMTLSRFLRDYLYISLGGNRQGAVRRYINLFTTMLLGGLWHGANWTFVCWGGLHGFYLITNHFWTALTQRHPILAQFRASTFWRVTAHVITFIAVVVGWVFFRSPNFSAAVHLLGGMVGLNGAVLPNGLIPLLRPLQHQLESVGIHFGMGSASTLIATYVWTIALLLIAFTMPNSNEIFDRNNPSVIPAGVSPARRTAFGINWSVSPRWAIASGAIAFLGVISITRASEFLYWQF